MVNSKEQENKKLAAENEEMKKEISQLKNLWLSKQLMAICNKLKNKKTQKFQKKEKAYSAASAKKSESIKF